MRPVNLLPPEQRASAPSGRGRGSAYVVVGALAIALVAALVYVLSANQVSTRKDEIGRAERDAATAQAKVGPLAAFGDFTSVKDARVAAVAGLAAGRLDWERLMREVSLVLPRGTWLLSFDGTAAASGSGAQPAGDGATAEVPKVKLTGCAPRQRDVAELLVRLRSLKGATEVALTESVRPPREAPSPAGPAGAPGAPTPAPASGSGGECGKDYKFDLTIELGGLPAPDTAPVSERLGGGS